jgi:hypothetical protein
VQSSARGVHEVTDSDHTRYTVHPVTTTDQNRMRRVSNRKDGERFHVPEVICIVPVHIPGTAIARVSIVANEPNVE